jgi:hypothetical protein
MADAAVTAGLEDLMARDQTAQSVADPEYWRKLCPSLGVLQDGGSKATPSPSKESVQANRARIDRDGYFTTNSGGMAADGSGPCALGASSGVDLPALGDAIIRCVCV